jgi:hypothetical protein
VAAAVSAVKVGEVAAGGEQPLHVGHADAAGSAAGHVRRGRGERPAPAGVQARRGHERVAQHVSTVHGLPPQGDGRVRRRGSARREFQDVLLGAEELVDADGPAQLPGQHCRDQRRSGRGRRGTPQPAMN